MDVFYHELVSLEEKAQKGFILVYEALDIIHKEEYWRDRYKSWENYLKVRWGYSLDYYLKLAHACTVNSNLKKAQSDDSEIKTNGLKPPKNERQARELSSLPPSQQIQVWEKVNDECLPDEITAQKIREVKLRMFNTSSKSMDKKPAIYDGMITDAVIIEEEPIDFPTPKSGNPVKIIEAILEATKRFGIDKSFKSWITKLFQVNKILIGQKN